MTSEDEKRLLILGALIRLGSPVTKKRVLDEIAGAGLMQFSEYDLRLRRSRNELNWRNGLAFIRDHLVRERHLSSEWNSWAITESGHCHFSTLAFAASSERQFQHISAAGLSILVHLAGALALSDDAALTGETVSLEGAEIHRWNTTYERDKNLRAAAIKIHGTKCIACKFDFFARYGSIGNGFIEVHHTKPVSSLGGPTQVNVVTDLVVLCSNCHSIVHRQKGEPLSVDALRELLSMQA